MPTDLMPILGTGCPARPGQGKNPTHDATSLALWPSGPLALWPSGPLALWPSGPLALWPSGPLDYNTLIPSPWLPPAQRQRLRNDPMQLLTRTWALEERTSILVGRDPTCKQPTDHPTMANVGKLLGPITLYLPGMPHQQALSPDLYRAEAGPSTILEPEPTTGGSLQRKEFIHPMTPNTPAVNSETQTRATATTVPGSTGSGRRPWLEPAVAVAMLSLAVTILALLVSIVFGIYSINTRIDTMGADLNTRMDALGAEVKADIRDLNARIDTMGAEVKADIRDLNARIDTMGAEVKADIRDLNARIDTMGTEVNARIDTMGTEVNARIDALGSDLNARMDTLGSSLNARIDALGSGLNARIEKVYQLLLPKDKQQ